MPSLMDACNRARLTEGSLVERNVSNRTLDPGGASEISTERVEPAAHGRYVLQILPGKVRYFGDLEAYGSLHVRYNPLRSMLPMDYNTSRKRNDGTTHHRGNVSPQTGLCFFTHFPSAVMTWIMPP